MKNMNNVKKELSDRVYKKTEEVSDYMRGYRKTFLPVLLAVLIATNVYASSVEVKLVSTETRGEKASPELIKEIKAQKLADADKFTQIKEKGEKFRDEYGRLVYETPDGVRHSFQGDTGETTTAEDYIETSGKGYDAMIDAYENPKVIGVVDDWSAITRTQKEHEEAVEIIKAMQEKRRKQWEKE
ncbi:MAG: hypothetical protein P9L90_05410 [Candidatus Aadella gelida]|nr:hypothetical protein [Candidatus Aadella gelida]